MDILSLRQNHGWAEATIRFFQRHWGSESSNDVYKDCILHCLSSPSPLPQWYLLIEGEEIIGGAGPITNDFNSRMHLWPWLCALYIEEDRRGHSYGKMLIQHIRRDAAALGFPKLYLCTDLVGYYEGCGFERIGICYHPWGESVPVYESMTGLG